MLFQLALASLILLTPSQALAQTARFQIIAGTPNLAYRAPTTSSPSITNTGRAPVLAREQGVKRYSHRLPRCRFSTRSSVRISTFGDTSASARCCVSWFEKLANMN